MKRLTYIVVILALVYSGYWFVGARTVENGVKTQLTQIQNDGWSVQYDTVATRGFPSRFDTTLTDVDMVAPDQSVGFMAPMIQVLSLSYQPNKAIIAFPPEQQVVLDGLPVAVISDGLRASVSANANTALSLDQVSAEATSIALMLDQAALSSVETMLGSLRESSAAPNTYDAYFTLANLVWPELILGQLPSTAGLPHQIDEITVDVAITLDRTLNRHTIKDWATDPGQLRGLTVRSSLITWGAYEISANGRLTVDASGTPDGTVTLTINDWEGLLNAVQALGMMPPQFQFIARSMGQNLSDGSQELILPISVQNGNLSVGPIPLGPAPKFN